MVKIAAYEMLLEGHPLWDKEATRYPHRNPYPFGSLPGDVAMRQRFKDYKAKKLAEEAAKKAKNAPLSRLRRLFRR